jgi:hypothetical protein
METQLLSAMRALTGFKNLDMKIVRILSCIQLQFIFQLLLWPLLDTGIFLEQIQVKNMFAFV